MLQLSDQHARERALDIQQSFIVQAPAGSGKTELLTQRFLKLLACVETPEEIVAITFTKKAAFEMRSRILAALEKASTPTTQHVLKRSQEKNWNLCAHPNRLRILTLDAFSLKIAQQLPISSTLGAQCDIVDDPEQLYQQAIRKILLTPPKNAAWREDIKTLLLHLDNNYYHVEKLLIELLKKRDQWLPLIFKENDNTKRRIWLEKELQHINDFALQKENKLSAALKAEIVALAEYATNNLSLVGTRFEDFQERTSCARAPYHPWSARPSNPQTLSTRKLMPKTNEWLFIADMLLTQKDELRKQANKTMGFPSAASSKNKAEKLIFEEYKQRYDNLVKVMQQQPEIIDWLIQIRQLPHSEYTDMQWQVLEALFTLLPYTVAQLRVEFAQQSQVDYVENAQNALRALGSDDEPTDISLQLDYKIQHMLVDEFQDTSNSQFELLKRLTAGWTPDDGRTLFLVGDPMQSIYRFRQAEVGLFLHAKHHGIGHIYLEFLSLESNFRSEPHIVNWINHTFTTIFPQKENIPLGAIPYSAALAVKEKMRNSNEFIQCLRFSDAEELAEEHYIIEKINYLKLHFPEESIAILIRSREHLNSITPLLQFASIAYQAIDIENLSHKPIIYDLLSLTHACTHLADRVAWLACLRAPWCGLTLNDLWIIAHNSEEKTIWQNINDETVINKLSQDGKEKLHYFKQAMTFAIQQRQRLSLRNIVETVFNLLPKQENSSYDVQQFFSLLEKSVDQNGVFQLDFLERGIKNLFAATPSAHENPVHIMTIHKAKGLEFDHVFLPKLHKKTAPLDKPLITWMEYPDDDNIYHLLMAPLHEMHIKDKTYDYIQQQQQQKLLLETDRVLYVAATRSKKGLYLTATLEEDKQASERSLLGRITSQHPSLFQKNTVTENIIASAAESHIRNNRIKRWMASSTCHDDNTRFDNEYSPQQENLPELMLSSQRMDKKIGTLIHLLIEQITKQGESWWESLSTSAKNTIIRQLCLQENVLQAQAIEKIYQAIHNLLQDPRGRWIIQRHQQAFSELALYSYEYKQWKKKIIDRVLIDEQGDYWIIDYKTSDFSEKIAAEHYQQLLEYYQALRQIVPAKHTIHRALYFPCAPAWYVYPSMAIC